ncbi:MAG: hypothetical protein ACYCV4_18945 [Dermatophilaceae bacterium]
MSRPAIILLAIMATASGALWWYLGRLILDAEATTTTDCLGEVDVISELIAYLDAQDWTWVPRGATMSGRLESGEIIEWDPETRTWQWPDITVRQETIRELESHWEES